MSNPIITNLKTANDLSDLLENNTGIIIIKLGATWCQPCKNIEPVVSSWLNKLEHENIQRVVLDIDECIDLYGLKSSININFILNRTLEDPKIVKNNMLPEIDEGTNISLLDLFNIDHKDVTGEIVTIIVKDLNKDIRISLDDKGVKIPKNFNNNT